MARKERVFIFLPLR